MLQAVTKGVKLMSSDALPNFELVYLFSCEFLQAISSS